MTTVRRSSEITKQVLELFHQNKCDSEIAAAIGITKYVVRNHRYKLNIKRSQNIIEVTNTLSVSDVLKDPTNRFLASLWTCENVRNCLV